MAGLIKDDKSTHIETIIAKIRFHRSLVTSLIEGIENGQLCLKFHCNSFLFQPIFLK